MDRATYLAILAALAVPVSAVPWFAALARRFNVSTDTLHSIYGQEVQHRVIRSHGALKAAAGGLLDQYLAGQDLLQLCWALDLPPCIVLRRLLELLPLGLAREKLTKLLRAPELVTELLPAASLAEHAAALRLLPPLASSRGATAAAGGGHGSSGAAVAAAAAAAAFQARLEVDIRACVACDRVYSPASDVGRREAGLAYEARLEGCLAVAGIAHWSEGELRQQGYHKTPDARLRVPIAVRGRLVNWIDSKATFGDERTHRQQLAEQYERYVNRFGPGLVIYWHGYLADLAAGDGSVLLLSDFPAPDDIFCLPRLPLSLAQGPLPQLGSGFVSSMAPAAGGIEVSGDCSSPDGRMVAAGGS